VVWHKILVVEYIPNIRRNFCADLMSCRIHTVVNA
jgi:hypothetical protein